VPKPRKDLVPRLPFKGGTINITVTDGEAAPGEKEVSRLYRDSSSEIRVIRRTSRSDIEPLLHTYTYRGRPLFEAWEPNAIAPLDHALVELRVAGYTLSRMGIAAIAMEPRKPLDPDLFLDGAAIGRVAAEITLGKDANESQFQEQMQAFIAELNATFGDTMTFDVNLGFVELPQPKDRERILKAIVAAVSGETTKIGKQHFSGELATLFAQYIVSERTDRPPFSGGAVSNVRGTPDFYTGTLRRIADKRDMKDYRVAGRETWLMVGMSESLLGPDTKGLFFGTDLELGQFDRIVLNDPSDYVSFTRVEAASERVHARCQGVAGKKSDQRPRP
jgi:hypothetical protein